MKEFAINKTDCNVENIGLYRGHMYIVVFYPELCHRCGYVLLNNDDCKEDLREYDCIVSAHGGLTYYDENADEFFTDGDLSNHRVIGWDYLHSWDGRDFQSAKEYYAKYPNPSMEELLTIVEEAYDEKASMSSKRIATRDIVTNDCKSVIDDLVYYRETGDYRWDSNKDNDEN